MYVYFIPEVIKLIINDFNKKLVSFFTSFFILFLLIIIINSIVFFILYIHIYFIKKILSLTIITKINILQMFKISVLKKKISISKIKYSKILVHL